MSKADDIRKEVLKSLSKTERAGFLLGVVRAVGSLTLKRQEMELELESDKKDVIDLIKTSLIFFGASDVRQSAANDGGKNARYIISLNSTESVALLKKLGVLTTDNLPSPGLSTKDISSEATARGVAKGLYAAAGTASLSEGDIGHGYHVELAVTSESVAEDLMILFRGLEMDKWRKIERKYNCGVYLKDSKQIFDFLILIGATKTALELQNAIAMKEMRNNLNRELNADSANLDKTLDAALSVIKDIELLEEKGVLQTLSPQLRLTAEVRRNNPELSLQELTERLGVATKSGVSHRIRKLQYLANALKVEH